MIAKLSQLLHYSIIWQNLPPVQQTPEGYFSSEDRIRGEGDLARKASKGNKSVESLAGEDVPAADQFHPARPITGRPLDRTCLYQDYSTVYAKYF